MYTYSRMLCPEKFCTTSFQQHTSKNLWPVWKNRRARRTQPALRCMVYISVTSIPYNFFFKHFVKGDRCRGGGRCCSAANNENKWPCSNTAVLQPVFGGLIPDRGRGYLSAWRPFLFTFRSANRFDFYPTSSIDDLDSHAYTSNTAVSEENTKI